MSPLWIKVYSATGDLLASLRHAEDAAAVVACNQGSVVKMGGRMVWREGREAFCAGESYDNAAVIMYERFSAHQHERLERRKGTGS